MKKLILAEALCGQTRLAVLEDGLLAEIYSESAEGERCVGNIYAGRVENVLPGMQAAFVNIGLKKRLSIRGGYSRGQERLGDRRKDAAQRLHQNALSPAKRFWCRGSRNPAAQKARGFPATLHCQAVIAFSCLRWIALAYREKSRKRKSARGCTIWQTPCARRAWELL